MREIPTVFGRDPANMRHVLPEVTPGCEWVIAGEGVATKWHAGASPHLLIPHGSAMKFPGLDLRDTLPRVALDVFKGYILQLPDGYEGIVWHHPDGRIAKLKRRDFA